ncbi:MAG: phasin family protein [Gammaproteobacteria bacterium]|nr:phasin family protein [Gammaproteobacteria bacterium]
MQNELIQEWSKLGKTTSEALKELGDINAKLIERLTEQQLALINATVEGSAKQTRLLTEAKGIQDVISGQANLTADYSQKVFAIARRTADLLNQSRQDITAWVEKGMKTAGSEGAKKPATPKTSA